MNVTTYRNLPPVMDITLREGHGKEMQFTDLRAEYKPLWWHDAGLSKTKSGYGKNIPTPWAVNWAGRLRRIYSTCYGNAASLHINVNGKKVAVM
ncbi:hypothetical protein LINGLNFE_00139 [Enterobacter phage phi63_307]|uniref:Uncharacterized protein n=1 Tax=Enterobacter phage phi63_307 TaxID=2340711 RepID=A0A386K5I6_9CAUD|nr:hypothetical protein LINGLNFE_00139 [Enterobacter phage phi63_307]